MSESTFSTIPNSSKASKGNSNKFASSITTSKSIFSLFSLPSNHIRQPSKQHGSDHSRKDKLAYRHHSTSSLEVKETHIMNKDYDPDTGNKMINKYMLVRELGRGVHGKVKLGKDMESGELVVSILFLLNMKT
jgi:hypothetical protein